MLAEIYRVLSPNGVFICVSNSIQEQRESFFKQPEFQWGFNCLPLAKPTISPVPDMNNSKKPVLPTDDIRFHWVYIMRKMPPASQ